MTRNESRPIAFALACRLGKDADASRVAEAVDGLWQEIDTALQPILGKGGVSALFKRSLHLAAESHPCLALAPADLAPDHMAAAVKAALLTRGDPEAAAAAGALFDEFYSLLASLVGASLTERLLRSVWAYTSTGSCAQDDPP